MHGKCPKDYLNAVCFYVESIFKDSIKNWTLHYADVPLQYDQENSLTGNCGIHMCSWAFIICTGNVYEFSEDVMGIIRRSISNILVYYQNTNSIELCEVATGNFSRITDIDLREGLDETISKFDRKMAPICGMSQFSNFVKTWKLYTDTESRFKL